MDVCSCQALSNSKFDFFKSSTGSKKNWMILLTDISGQQKYFEHIWVLNSHLILIFAYVVCTFPFFLLKLLMWLSKVLAYLISLGCLKSCHWTSGSSFSIVRVLWCLVNSVSFEFHVFFCSWSISWLISSAQRASTQKLSTCCRLISFYVFC